jgi:uncharacterized protein YndB with AHSA1/START domain
MSEYGTVFEPASVRFERLLPGPIERVWSYLTDPELRGTWFASGPLEPRVGGTVKLTFRHSQLAPPGEKAPEKHAGAEGHTTIGRITQWDPPQRLAFLWDESEVVFELAPKGDEVLLTLTHRKLPNRDELRSVSSGWHTHLAVLGERLRGEPLRPFWPRIEKLEREYAERIR